jgi:hypothetical protein
VALSLSAEECCYQRTLSNKENEMTLACKMQNAINAAEILFPLSTEKQQADFS